MIWRTWIGSRLRRLANWIDPQIVVKFPLDVKTLAWIPKNVIIFKNSKGEVDAIISNVEMPE